MTRTVKQAVRLCILGMLTMAALMPGQALAQGADGTQQPTFTTTAAQDLVDAILANSGGWQTTETNDSNQTSSHRNSDGRTATCRLSTTDGVIRASCSVTNPDNTTNDVSVNATSGLVLSEDRDAAGALTASSLEKPKPEGCSITGGLGNIGECIAIAFGKFAGWVIGGIALVLLTIASVILWIAGGLFNWVVIKTVFEFGSTFGTSEGMLIAWGILRDIGNIVLLFGFIFMGLATILNTHALDEYSARKALPRLVIFAVLMNFSLFAAQIVIDTSNSLAAVFTAEAGFLGCTGQDRQGTDGMATQDACANDGIAGRVIQMAGISSVLSLQGAGDFALQSERAAPVYIGLTIFVTITAVVLFAAAIMLVIRAVVLSLLMVLSPIGFAGMAIPPLQEFARSWWKKLLSNAFFAPVYLLLVLISLKILEGLVGENSGGSFATAMINGGANAPQMFVIFAVVIAFMVMSLIVAKSMGAAGADFATKSAGGAVLGTYGFIGRRTVGRTAAGAANAIYSSKWGQRNGRIMGIPGTSARNLAGVLKNTSEKSFSARSLATGLGKGAHLDFGKPNKTAAHGFHGIEEKATKEREEYFKKLKPTAEQKGVATETQEEINKIKEELESRRADKLAAVEEQRLKVQAARLSNNEELLKKERAILDQRIKEFDEANNDDDGKDLKKRQDELNKRLKAWNARADQAKTDTYVNEALHGQWYPPGSVGTHADHEAAANIRKNAGKSKLEKALKEVQEAAEKGGEGGEESHDDSGGGDKGGGDGGHGPAPH